ncbi:hypothetical protein J4N45_10850 [Vibrio sp. SCSIO 43140]|uniref:hypothetical protein n=1 Tax=Vibrio sp. SCSIO 43140 TaxID=2819100 RepID=UPI002074ACDC|nr:hypothetical protein [Vibrio sp. SCSIO 43140]USD59028.1 hypothetical protein J4N45_10850 [Vibrio sp. SCSIO 43140]
MKQPYIVVTHAEGYEPDSYLVYAEDEENAWELVLNWLSEQKLLHETRDQYLDHVKSVSEMQKTAIGAPHTGHSFTVTE